MSAIGAKRTSNTAENVFGQGLAVPEGLRKTCFGHVFRPRAWPSDRSPAGTAASRPPTPAGLGVEQGPRYRSGAAIPAVRCLLRKLPRVSGDGGGSAPANKQSPFLGRLPEFARFGYVIESRLGVPRGPGRAKRPRAPRADMPPRRMVGWPILWPIPKLDAWAKWWLGMSGGAAHRSSSNETLR